MIIAGLIISNVKTNGQGSEINQKWNNDNLFPAKGKSSILIATGIPFAGAIEYRYGFSNKFSAGVFYGKILGQKGSGYGLRLRGVLYSSGDNFRIYGELPIVYYPPTKRLESWFILYPTIMFEKRFSSGLRISAGAGLPGAGCMDAVFGGHDEQHEITDETKKSVFTNDGGVMGGIWYTLNSGIAFPISNKIMFTERLDVVANGIKVGDLIAKNWISKPPIIAVIGLSFAL